MPPRLAGPTAVKLQALPPLWLRLPVTSPLLLVTLAWPLADLLLAFSSAWTPAPVRPPAALFAPRQPFVAAVLPLVARASVFWNVAWAMEQAAAAAAVLCLATLELLPQPQCGSSATVAPPLDAAKQRLPALAESQRRALAFVAQLWKPALCPPAAAVVPNSMAEATGQVERLRLQHGWFASTALLLQAAAPWHLALAER